jgi:hypothetical protein
MAAVKSAMLRQRFIAVIDTVRPPPVSQNRPERTRRPAAGVQPPVPALQTRGHLREIDAELVIRVLRVGAASIIGQPQLARDDEPTCARAFRGLARRRTLRAMRPQQGQADVAS